jgi:hypothetical protein
MFSHHVRIATASRAKATMATTLGKTLEKTLGQGPWKPQRTQKLIQAQEIRPQKLETVPGHIQFQSQPQQEQDWRRGEAQSSDPASPFLPA